MSQKREASPTALVVAMALIGAFVLYVLSVGPAILLRDHGVISQGTLLTIYAPLAWACRFATVNALIESYGRLWSRPPTNW